MVKQLVHDPVFLAQPSQDAGPEDLDIATDLRDTLQAHLSGCVGMAANMIGERKRIIAFVQERQIRVMFNPRLLEKKGEYTAEEGCLSLNGVRSVKRANTIRVSYQDERMRTHIQTLHGFTAQIVQHEMDHCSGILI